jgi:hypothetical protein
MNISQSSAGFMFYDHTTGNNTFLTKNNKYTDISPPPTLFLILKMPILLQMADINAIYITQPALKMALHKQVTHICPPAHSSLLTLKGSFFVLTPIGSH